MYYYQQYHRLNDTANYRTPPIYKSIANVPLHLQGDPLEELVHHLILVHRARLAHEELGLPVHQRAHLQQLGDYTLHRMALRVKIGRSQHTASKGPLFAM